ncbi:MAG: DNA primase [Proteobacteria bacterium]|nr:DNA primase [Pseudomonadota bacterium]
MGRIPEATIQEIRDRLDIADLIGRYVELKKAGRNWKGLCPFHQEKTPSFNVNPDRQIFHCFGCQAGGDVIGFLMKHENLSFPEAARALAHELGISVPEADGRDQGVVEALVRANQVAQELYRRSLASDAGAHARAYLEGRGLGPEDWERFGIGFAPDRWDGVATALRQAGLSGETGEKAGLLAPRERGGHYDRLRGRVTFPIHDVRGRIVGFGGRALGDATPKYLNTPETPLFHKRQALYGFPAALEPVRRAERAIVCEGYFDRIALARAGLGEGLATCGTALTPDHGRQLRRRTRQVVLLFDGDAAGRTAVERALEVLLPEGLRVRAVALPAGEDPDSFLLAHGATALAERVAEAEDAIAVVLRAALADGAASPGEKADAVARLGPLVARVADPVERAEYERRLAVAIGVELAAVREAIRRSRGGVATPTVELPEASVRRLDPREGLQLRRLARALLRDRAVAGQRERLEALLPTGPERQAIAALAELAVEQGGEGALDLRPLEDRLEKASFAFLLSAAAEEAEADEVDAAHTFAAALQWFERRERRARQRETTRRLQDLDATDARALLADKQRQLEERRAAQRAAADGGPMAG